MKSEMSEYGVLMRPLQSRRTKLSLASFAPWYGFEVKASKLFEHLPIERPCHYRGSY